MKLAAALVGLVLCLGLVACGGGDAATAPTATVSTGAASSSPLATIVTTKQPKPEESAEDFYVRMLELVYSGQHGKRWDNLHPEQQAVVPRSKFVECSQERGTNTAIKVKVLDSYDEPVQLLGRDVPSTAVVVEVSGNIGSFGQPETQRDTYHAIMDGTHWRWLLPPRTVAAFQSGICPQ